MPIQSGDIKLVASKVMADVPEGGGGPTAVLIPDGGSNNIFRDISEQNRALGDVSIRKVFVHVRTPDTDSYLGANVIVAEPPDDPNVSITLVQVDDFYSQRSDIKNRLESYLAMGPVYAGYLFGDMFQGQRTVTICQREEAALPISGDTLVLRKYAGLPNEVVQFVRATAMTSTLRTFVDTSGPFQMRIVTVSIGDALEADFPGFNATRIDPDFEVQKARTQLFDAVVADAARYYG